MMVNDGYNNNLIGGKQPLWKMMEFVSWDDDIPNIWKNKIHVPNHRSRKETNDQLVVEQWKMVNYLRYGTWP